MQLKHADKVLKIVEKIKALDADIIKLEALAMQAANGENTVVINFEVTDLSKKEEVENKVTFDEDGSITLNISHQIGMYLMPRVSFGGCSTATKDESKSTFKEEIKDVTAMQIFGLLIQGKQAQREGLLQSLKKYGVKI